MSANPRPRQATPANEASWADLAAIFGTADYASRCFCQRLKVSGWIWRGSTQEQRKAMFIEQTACDEPASPEKSGLVAYLDDEPVGWIAVEPRIAYPKLRTLRVPWKGRDEDKATPVSGRSPASPSGRAIGARAMTYVLAQAAVGFARKRGARAIEGYAMVTRPGREITWGELHVGAKQVFEEAGFGEVHQPTVRRVIMRIDFEPTGS